MKPKPNPVQRAKTKPDHGHRTVSFSPGPWFAEASFWKKACLVVSETGLDASAIQGRLGAQVALLQSPIPRAARSGCNRRSGFARPEKGATNYGL